MTAIILDTETTSREKPEVIELAWKGHPTGFVAGSRFKPVGPCEWGALATHHILPEDYANAPPPSEALGMLPDAEYWIGHNIDYDWNALGSPVGVKRICTLAMCRHLWPEVDSHSLSAMIYFICGANPQTRERVRTAHGAAADVLMCATILDTVCKVAKLDPLDFERLYAFSEDARVPRVMTFGKFEGKPISAVDRGYMNWYARQPDPDPYVLEAFRRAGF